MESESYSTLGVRVEAGVATVTIDHGEINLMDMAMLVDLDRLGQRLESDPAVKVVVLQSANPEFFIAHADIKVIGQLPATPPPREEELGWVHATLDRFRTMPKATIAKIQGRCRGGGSELALACDMRFAEIGRGRALEIILGCGDFPAELAERYGYVNRAVPAGEIDFFVQDLARRIAGFPAETIAMAKQAVRFQEAGLENDLAREERVFLESVHTAVARRRMTAALAAGMQTPPMEKCCFDHVWGPLAET